MLFASAGPALAAVEVGDTAPNNAGTDADGEMLQLDSRRGKVVALVFWASWCGQCQQELPILEQFQRKAGDDNLEIVAINWKEDRSALRTLRRQMRKWQMTVTHDPDGALGETYGVRGVPHLVLVARDGIVEHIKIGYRDQSLDGLIEQFNRVLSQP